MGFNMSDNVSSISANTAYKAGCKAILEQHSNKV